MHEIQVELENHKQGPGKKIAIMINKQLHSRIKNGEINIHWHESDHEQSFDDEQKDIKLHEGIKVTLGTGKVVDMADLGVKEFGHTALIKGKELERTFESVCPICTKGLSKSWASACKVRCGHWFHWICLKGWTDLGKESCPVCRQPFRNT